MLLVGLVLSPLLTHHRFFNRISLFNIQFPLLELNKLSVKDLSKETSHITLWIIIEVRAQSITTNINKQQFLRENNAISSNLS